MTFYRLLFWIIDVLHTQGKEYLVEDITDYVREKGVNV